MPLRTTVSEMGPLLLSRILDLNDTQSDILSIIFKIADDEGLLLIDTKDLRAMLQYVSENAKEYSMQYGNMSSSSLAAIIRSVVALEGEGGEQFFGEPALNIADWFSRNCDGKGCIQILDCQRLINNPTMYATFLLWMLSELFELLPEAGDLEKPKMVFFFDEAHMLFDSASKALLTKIEQVVKLIRSKGVGIYFVTQNPKDIPGGVLSQLGNKIQHALHAYTPSEQKGAKAAAQSFRENPAFNTYDTLLELGIGEALVSVLDEGGVPTIVERCQILPPQSKMALWMTVNARKKLQTIFYTSVIRISLTEIPLMNSCKDSPPPMRRLPRKRLKKLLQRKLLKSRHWRSRKPPKSRLLQNRRPPKDRLLPHRKRPKKQPRNRPLPATEQ